MHTDDIEFVIKQLCRSGDQRGTLLGCSARARRKTYGHHSVEHLRIAVDMWSKRPANRA
jgi:hypothetical protein